MTPECRPGDTVEQSFCRQRTEEEQAAIEGYASHELSEEDWQIFVARGWPGRGAIAQQVRAVDS